jgi:hypothetical protein
VNIATRKDDPLADELKRATDLLERIMALPVLEMPERKAVETQPIRQYMTFNIPAQAAPEVKFEIPMQAAPTVTVVNNVPEQAAPVVNVNVEPTPVQIQNEVIVKPSQSAKVIRDINGKIAGLEAE